MPLMTIFFVGPVRQKFHFPADFGQFLAGGSLGLRLIVAHWWVIGGSLELIRGSLGLIGGLLVVRWYYLGLIGVSLRLTRSYWGLLG